MRIRELREIHGLMQKDLAKILGVANNTLSQYETGTRIPDYRVLKAMANYFNVSIDYLVGNDGNLEGTQPHQGSAAGFSRKEKQLIEWFRALPDNMKAEIFSYAEYKYRMHQNAVLHNPEGILHDLRQEIDHTDSTHFQKPAARKK
ncbi:MAG: helix-turn-helix domain-containing protein [Christensenellales bacterium]